MKYKFIDSFGPEPIRIIKNPTPEQEAEILAQYKAQLDPEKVKQECLEALEQANTGPTFDEILAELDAIDQTDVKESA